MSKKREKFGKRSAGGGRRRRRRRKSKAQIRIYLRIDLAIGLRCAWTMRSCCVELGEGGEDVAHSRCDGDVSGASLWIIKKAK